MADLRTFNNIQAQLFFLSLVLKEVPDVCSGPQMSEAMHSFLEYICRPDNIGIRHNFLGFPNVTLQGAMSDDRLRSAFEAWSTMFNLRDSWCIDQLLETLVLSTVQGKPIAQQIEQAWHSALVNRNQKTRSMLWGPRLSFTYSWPTRLTTDSAGAFRIEVVYQNPARILDESFLNDIKEQFAGNVLTLLRGENLVTSDDKTRWSRLEDIAHEIESFSKKIDRFGKKAKIAIKSFLRGFHNLNPFDTGISGMVTTQIRSRRMSRNLRWLLFYQVKRMSYGEIAKVENAREKTVIDGVKTAAKLVQLSLRRPNKSGRKIGSPTKKSTMQVVR